MGSLWLLRTLPILQTKHETQELAEVMWVPPTPHSHHPHPSVFSDPCTGKGAGERILGVLELKRRS